MKNILIIVNKLPGESEAFIQFHLNYFSEYHNLYLLVNHKLFVKKDDLNLIVINQFEKIYFRILHLFHLVFSAHKIKLYKHFVFYRRVKALNIKLIISEYGDVGAENATWITKSKIRNVVFFRGGEIYVKSKFETYKDLYKLLLKSGSFFVGVSNDIVTKLHSLVEESLDNRQIIYSPSGADKLFFQLRRRDLSEEKLILSVGRFVEKKQHGIVILALNDLLRDCNNLKLILVGSGPFKSFLIHLADYLGLNNKIEFVDYLNQNELSRLFSKASILNSNNVCAHDGDQEGTPGVVMEAMASSLPVIVTKHGGNLDLINHGENGFLIDEFDVESLAQVVSEILRNENQALRIGQNAHQTIIKNGLSKKECLEFVLNKVEFSS